MSSDHYYYLISSLPGLSLARPDNHGLDSETLLERCRESLSETRFQQLQSFSLVPSGRHVCHLDAAWQAWETYLRNLLVWGRCHHTGCDQAHHWIRPETDVFPGIVRQVDEALSEDTPLEREQILDQLRWQRLDELSVGHEFDFEALAVYRLRLLLVEKWRRHDTEHGRKAFTELTDIIFQRALELRQ